MSSSLQVLPTAPERLVCAGNNFAYGESFFHEFVISRALYTAALPAFLVKEAVVLIRDTVRVAAVAGTLGLMRDFNIKVFQDFDSTCRRLLTRPYACVIKFLNPGADVPTYILDDEPSKHKTPKLYGADANHFLVCHVFTRVVGVPIRLIVETIKHLAKLAFGVGCAALSICFLGRFKPLNNLAFNNLESAVIIKEIILLVYSFH